MLMVRRFRLGETLHYTEENKVANIEIVSITPAGAGSLGSNQSYSIGMYPASQK
jgi:hypothetical protein